MCIRDSRVQWAQQGFGTKYTTGTGHIRLLKANHIPGSSQVYVDANGKSLLYSGDFSFPDVQIEHADYLVIDATHGDPWYDGRTDRKSVMNRMFEDVQGNMGSNRPVVIQTSSGTLQELVRHFEVVCGPKFDDSVAFVMNKNQENVLVNIYKDEQKEFRNIVRYDSKEYWKLIRNNQKIVVFSTTSVLSEELRSFYKIIIDQFRFTRSKSPIIPFDGGCRYNLAAHASINDIYCLLYTSPSPRD